MEHKRHKPQIFNITRHNRKVSLLKLSLPERFYFRYVGNTKLNFSALQRDRLVFDTLNTLCVEICLQCQSRLPLMC